MGIGVEEDFLLLSEDHAEKSMSVHGEGTKV
jgi:hypothetical protein